MKHLAVVGTGTLGKAIALRLLASGYQLSLYNRTFSKAADIAHPQSVAVRDLRELLTDAQPIILLCVTDAQSIRALFCQPDIAQRLAQTQPVILNISTIGPQESERLEAWFHSHGAFYTECPVSGGPEGALAGTLAAWIGSIPVDFRDRILPVIYSLADKCAQLDDNRAAQTMKVINNYCEALHLLIAAEAILVARRMGLAADKLQQALLLGRGRSVYMGVMLQRYLHPGSQVSVPLAIRLKDLALARMLFQRCGIESPYLENTRSVYQQTMGLTTLPQDQTACFTWLSEVLYR